MNLSTGEWQALLRVHAVEGEEDLPEQQAELAPCTAHARANALPSGAQPQAASTSAAAAAAAAPGAAELIALAYTQRQQGGATTVGQPGTDLPVLAPLRLLRPMTLSGGGGGGSGGSSPSTSTSSYASSVLNTADTSGRASPASQVRSWLHVWRHSEG